MNDLANRIVARLDSRLDDRQMRILHTRCVLVVTHPRSTARSVVDTCLVIIVARVDVGLRHRVAGSAD